MNGYNDARLEMRVILILVVRTIAWIMIGVAIITAVMTFLSTFRIYVTSAFSTAKTLIYVLMLTFGAWALRCRMDARSYPTFRIYSWVFLVLALTAAYLMTTSVF